MAFVSDFPNNGVRWWRKILEVGAAWAARSQDEGGNESEE